MFSKNLKLLWFTLPNDHRGFPTAVKPLDCPRSLQLTNELRRPGPTVATGGPDSQGDNSEPLGCAG